MILKIIMMVTIVWNINTGDLIPDIERIIYQFLNVVDRDHNKKYLHAKYDTSLFFSYCIPNRRDVLTRIFNNPDVYDIRWMAYMLATTYWESAFVVTTNITRPASIQYFVDLTQTISLQDT